LKGAAFHGASLSRQFKTKNIKVSDIIVHDIQASYLSAPSAVTGTSRTINTIIFPAGSKVGNKKTLTFKRKEDFSVWLDYKNSLTSFVSSSLWSLRIVSNGSNSGLPSQILEAEVAGIHDAFDNLTARGAVDPVVKATVRLSESGFVSVPDAVAFGDISDSSFAGTKNISSRFIAQLDESFSGI
jgi:hypoxia up-regulated 1